MFAFALDGPWLVGALAVAFAAGVFSAQYVKDKITGVPSGLRTVLSGAEKSALTLVADAKAKAVADVAKTFSAMPVIPKAIVVAAPTAPARAAPAAPVA
jgi:hypothetical protein